MKINNNIILAKMLMINILHEIYCKIMHILLLLFRHSLPTIWGQLVNYIILLIIMIHDIISLLTYKKLISQ